MKNTLKGCAVAAAMLGAGSVSAGGLWLNEYGDFAGGRAAAGASAGTDEAMTIAYNPASLSRLQGSQLFVSGGAYIGTLKFDTKYSNPRNGYNDGDDAGKVAPAAAMAYVNDLGSDKWSAGVFLGGLSGSGMNYSDDWVGRYQATNVSLMLMALAPSVSYQVTDKLSVGVTAQAIYADLTLEMALPRLDPNLPDGKGKLDGDDVKPGFNLGAMYELSPRTRFGVFYQSHVDIEFDGDLKGSIPLVNIDPGSSLGRDVSTDTKMDFAQYARFSVHQQMSDRWSVDFTVGWDDWSSLGNVLVSTQDGAAGIPTQWKDTYHYAWGAQYKLNEDWDLTGGVAYDSSPVDSEDRNAQLPVDRQIRYASGARYKVRDGLTVGGYLMYMDLGKARITGTRFGGDYKANDVLQIAVNANWSF
ncbi:MAG: outer membrane protein transport protein [Halioglobus sp.]|jgi:long-chain fatty acid transport protein|nr:outer membrane protein transport protein [Halioglobus sp.]